MRPTRIIIAVLLLAAIAAPLLLPADVPDANSPEMANNTMLVNGANSVGQSFISNRNGLNRVDMMLAVDNPNDQTTIAFQVMEIPWTQARSVTVKVSDLPVGTVGISRPGTILERWYSFRFDPITDSGGKRMFFSLEGKDIQGPNSVGLLAFFHNRYPDGEAYLNGTAINAHLVFRSYARGRLADVLVVGIDNLVRTWPGPFARLAVYAILGFLYVAAGVAILLTATGGYKSLLPARPYPEARDEREQRGHVDG